MILPQSIARCSGDFSYGMEASVQKEDALAVEILIVFGTLVGCGRGYERAAHSAFRSVETVLGWWYG